MFLHNGQVQVQATGKLFTVTRQNVLGAKSAIVNCLVDLEEKHQSSMHYGVYIADRKTLEQITIWNDRQH